MVFLLDDPIFSLCLFVVGLNDVKAIAIFDSSEFVSRPRHLSALDQGIIPAVHILSQFSGFVLPILVDRECCLSVSAHYRPGIDALCQPDHTAGLKQVLKSGVLILLQESEVEPAILIDH